MKKPNIVIFMPETMRADSVFGEGTAKAKTPYMESIGNEGVRFLNVFSQHPVCSPSRCSMFSGLYPHTNGHRTLTSLIQKNEHNLFRDLKDNGYTTICFGKNDLLSKESQELSFDSTDLTVHPIDYGFKESVFPKDHKHYKSFYMGMYPNEDRKDYDWACVQSALNFLNSRHEKPFCLYLPLNDAHPPYCVEEPFFSMHDRTCIPEPIPPEHNGKRRFMNKLHHNCGIDKLSVDDLKEIKATYWGMVSRADHHLGLIVDKLKQQDIYDNTAIFILSDHGDYTGDYGLIEKWFNGLEDVLLHVPLIMKIPEYPSVGKRECLVEMTDIYPTILETAGIDCSHYHFGKSLLGLCRSDSEDKHREFVFSEGGHNTYESNIHDIKHRYEGVYFEKCDLYYQDPVCIAKTWMVRDKRYKFIYCPNEHNELYDLVNDPKELKNLAEETNMSCVVTDMKDKILEWLTRTADHISEIEDPRGWSD